MQRLLTLTLTLALPLLLTACDLLRTSRAECVRTPGVCAERLNELDADISAQLTAGADPDALEQERAQLLDEMKIAIAADGADRPIMQALAGLWMSAHVREALGNQPLKTPMTSMADLPECRVDLALGRHFARYGFYVAAEEAKAHRAALIGELNNGAYCLGPVQLEQFVNAVGDALGGLFEHLDGVGASEDKRRWALSGVLQPATTLFDLSQHQGRTSLYGQLFAQQQLAASTMVEELDVVLVHDRFSDGLFALRPSVVAERLDVMLDPVAIGRGQCGLGERLLSAIEMGEGGCGRGLACGPAADPGMLDRTATHVSPFGQAFASLREADCPESSTGGGQNGSGVGGFGAGGYAACILNSMMTGHKNVGQCVLDAARDGYEASTVDVLGGEGPYGQPVFRRGRSADECGTNPYADAHANARQDVEGEDDGEQKTVVAGPKDNKFRLNATFTGEKASQYGSRQVVEAYVDTHYSDADFDKSEAAIDGGGDAEIVLVEDLEEKTGLLGQAGTTSDGSKVILIDAAAWAAGGGNAGGYTYTKEQLVTHEWTHHADTDLGGETADHNEEDVRENDRQHGNVTPASGDDVLPGDPDRVTACGPQADAMREMMTCYGHPEFTDGENGVVIPDEELSPAGGNSSPENTDPSQDQWNAANFKGGGALNCALDGHIAIGRNGSVHVIERNDVSETCKVTLCEAVDEDCACLGQTRGYVPLDASHVVLGMDCRLVDCAQREDSPCCGGAGDISAIVGALPDLGGGDPTPEF